MKDLFKSIIKKTMDEATFIERARIKKDLKLILSTLKAKYNSDKSEFTKGQIKLIKYLFKYELSNKVK